MQARHGADADADADAATLTFALTTEAATHGRRHQRHIDDTGEMDGSEGGGEMNGWRPAGHFLASSAGELLSLLLFVVVEWFACCVDCVVDVRVKNAQPTQ